MDKMRWGFYCAAPFCTNKQYNKTRSFFCFPSDFERARIWAIAAGRKDLLENEKIPFKSKSYRLCGAHFENRMFLNDLKNRLLKNAVPTIFPCRSSLVRNEHDYYCFIADVPRPAACSTPPPGDPLSLDNMEEDINPEQNLLSVPVQNCNSSIKRRLDQTDTDDISEISEVISPRSESASPFYFVDEAIPSSSSSTQTPKAFIVSTLQRDKLKKTIKSLRNKNLFLDKRNKILQKKIDNLKKNVSENASVEDYNALTCKFCFSKESHKVPRGRRFSIP